MNIDTVAYLVEIYWPFLAGAAFIGLVTGWWSVRRKGAAK